MSAKGLKLKQEIQADLDFREEMRSSNELPAEPTSRVGGTLTRPDAGVPFHSGAPAVQAQEKADPPSL
jgi:hypothetical protein